MQVYKCINAVQADLAKTGVGKDQRNQMQGYNFRGIDSIFNALAPLLAHHGLCILPEVKSRSVTERATNKGGILFCVVVEMNFHFVAAQDGSSHIISTFGEAMDSADKATNKAMSAAYKYAAMQAFCIPTVGEDADGDTHVLAAKEPEPKELSMYEQVCQMIALKHVSADEVKGWCAQHNVNRLSAMDDVMLHQILTILSGR